MGSWEGIKHSDNITLDSQSKNVIALLLKKQVGQAKEEILKIRGNRASDLATSSVVLQKGLNHASNQVGKVAEKATERVEGFMEMLKQSQKHTDKIQSLA